MSGAPPGTSRHKKSSANSVFNLLLSAILYYSIHLRLHLVTAEWMSSLLHLLWKNLCIIRRGKRLEYNKTHYQMSSPSFTIFIFVIARIEWRGTCFVASKCWGNKTMKLFPQQWGKRRQSTTRIGDSSCRDDQQNNSSCQIDPRVI